MLPTLPTGVLLLELVCGWVRALAMSVGGSVMSQAVWLIAVMLPAAYWVADRLVVSSWSASHGASDGS